jgi:hypothetical protein
VILYLDTSALVKLYVLRDKVNPAPVAFAAFDRRLLAAAEGAGLERLSR